MTFFENDLLGTVKEVETRLRESNFNKDPNESNIRLPQINVLGLAGHGKSLVVQRLLGQVVLPSLPTRRPILYHVRAIDKSIDQYAVIQGEPYAPSSKGTVCSLGELSARLSDVLTGGVGGQQKTDPVATAAAAAADGDDNAPRSLIRNDDGDDENNADQQKQDEETSDSGEKKKKALAAARAKAAAQPITPEHVLVTLHLHNVVPCSVLDTPGIPLSGNRNITESAAGVVETVCASVRPANDKNPLPPVNILVVDCHKMDGDNARTAADQLTHNPAAQVLKRLDPSGTSSVGVITKFDNCSARTHQAVRGMLQGSDLDQMCSHWVALGASAPEDEIRSVEDLQQMAETEERNIGQHVPNTGLAVLHQRLHTKLSVRAKHIFEKLLMQVHVKNRELSEKCLEMGKDVNLTEAKNHIINGIIRFCQTYCKGVQNDLKESGGGNNNNNNVNVMGAGTKMRAEMHANPINKLSLDLMKWKNDMAVELDIAVFLDDESLRRAVLHADTLEPSLLASTAERVLKDICRTHINTYFRERCASMIKNYHEHLAKFAEILTEKHVNDWLFRGCRDRAAAGGVVDDLDGELSVNDIERLKLVQSSVQKLIMERFNELLKQRRAVCRQQVDRLLFSEAHFINITHDSMEEIAPLPNQKNLSDFFKVHWHQGGGGGGGAPGGQQKKLELNQTRIEYVACAEGQGQDERRLFKWLRQNADNYINITREMLRRAVPPICHLLFVTKFVLGDDFQLDMRRAFSGEGGKIHELADQMREKDGEQERRTQTRMQEAAVRHAGIVLEKYIQGLKIAA